jgi:putative secretion ATPase (PEP-CTERM system associated)
MYEPVYHFAADPFRLSPDQRFSFQHRSYHKAKAYLRYALNRAEGFVMITGTPGSGKTTLLNDLLTEIDPARTVTAHLVTTQLEASDLLRLVTFAFGLRAEGLDKATLIQHLERFLLQQYHARKRALLIIDEAQDLTDSALEEMRLLTNLQHKNIPLLQVFLVGQEGLQAMVQKPAMEQLLQRMIASSRLDPMAAEETAAYVLHRLRIAGWHQDPQLSIGALRRIHLFSRGIPRRVNQLCSRLLLYGSLEEKHRLDSKDVQAVIAELREEQLLPAGYVEPPDGDLEADDVVIALPTDAWLRSAAEPPSGAAVQATAPAAPGAAAPAIDPEDGATAPVPVAEASQPPPPALAVVVPTLSASSPQTGPEPGVEEALQTAEQEAEQAPVPDPARPAKPLFERRWVLREKDSEQGFFAIVGIALSVLLGALLAISVGGSSSPAQATHDSASLPRNAATARADRELAQLRHRITRELAGKVSLAGTGSAQGLALRLNNTRQFAVGSTQFNPDMGATLQTLATILRDHAHTVLRIVGHSDVSGTERRNKVLSNRRARVVADYFLTQGIAAARLRTEGRGSRQLRSLTDQAQNRRVDLYVELAPPAST